jgi:hypothetical protein
MKLSTNIPTALARRQVGLGNKVNICRAFQHLKQDMLQLVLQQDALKDSILLGITRTGHGCA